MEVWSTILGAGSLERRVNEQYKVYYAMIPAREIFGMVGRCGGGYNTIWVDWSEEGRRKRDLIMQEYEEGLDEICGHYRELESSILQEGIRNPVVITCGPPKKRPMECLPPEMRCADPKNLLLLETTMGGSRLHVCQKHDMEIPCIVNDWTGRFRGFAEIKTEADARKYYLDQPRGLTFNPKLGLVESFDQNKISHHLGERWSEEKIMPLRAPLWIGIMNKYGYRIDNLPKIVLDVLYAAGIDQNNLNR